MPGSRKLIDIHCHCAGTGAGESGCHVSPRLRNSWKYSLYLRAFGVRENELLREGDGLILGRLSEILSQSQRVASAVVLAMDGVVDERGDLDLGQTEVYVPNTFVERETRRYPNLLFGASINPLRNDALEQLEEAADNGAKLLKWLPSIQRIDPSDGRFTPFYKKMTELGIPLLTHTGNEHSFTKAFNEYADPERLRLPQVTAAASVSRIFADLSVSPGNFPISMRTSRPLPS
jgi:hypothetical protein